MFNLLLILKIAVKKFIIRAYKILTVKPKDFFVNKQNVVAEIDPSEQDEKAGTQFKSNEQFLNILLLPEDLHPRYRL